LTPFPIAIPVDDLDAALSPEPIFNLAQDKRFTRPFSLS
jgi:hypothetical protein